MSGSTEVHRRRAYGVVAFAVGVLALIGLVIGAAVSAPIIGLAVGAVVAVAVVVLAWRTGPAAILRWSRARAVDEREQARLHNLVDGLSASVGIRPPDVYVIDDPASNAFVVGRTPAESSIAVTTGLLVASDRIRLEAIVAVLLGRIRSGEASSSTLSATVLGGPVIGAELLSRSGRFAALGSMATSLASVLAPVLRRAAPPQRILDADVDACSLTRYPPGLRSALTTLSEHSTVTSAGLCGTAHLWLASPLGLANPDGRAGSTIRRFASHPPLDERITRVREL